MTSTVLSLLDQEGGLMPPSEEGCCTEALSIRLQRELEKLPRVPAAAPDNYHLTAG